MVGTIIKTRKYLLHPRCANVHNYWTDTEVGFDVQSWTSPSLVDPRAGV